MKTHDEALQHILTKYGISLETAKPSPILIRETRHGGLTKLFAELGYKVGAEVGVEQGRFSEEICRDNPGVELHCIDPWLSYDRYDEHPHQEEMDKCYLDAQARLSKYGCHVLRQTSMQAVQTFSPNSLDFVYIDANHEFQHVVNDICEWYRIVKPGGMLAGHDYRGGDSRIAYHVIQATHAFTDAYNIKPWFVFRRDKAPSWLWIK